mmetsp:Transcript_106894/g.238605  ORF Transcript_106894/g.238605 Transcript_106894/m.238605 type:complete len:288 (-) Transcript_106894:648-1511(-)
MVMSSIALLYFSAFLSHRSCAFLTTLSTPYWRSLLGLSLTAETTSMVDITSEMPSVASTTNFVMLSAKSKWKTVTWGSELTPSLWPTRFPRQRVTGMPGQGWPGMQISSRPASGFTSSPPAATMRRRSSSTPVVCSSHTFLATNFLLPFLFFFLAFFFSCGLPSPEPGDLASSSSSEFSSITGSLSPTKQVQFPTQATCMCFSIRSCIMTTAVAPEKRTSISSGSQTSIFRCASEKDSVRSACMVSLCSASRSLGIRETRLRRRQFRAIAATWWPSWPWPSKTPQMR